MSYVVNAAIGQVGSTVVNHLLAQSIPVHVVIRSENRAELFRSCLVDVAIADVTDTGALTKTFPGAQAVFAVNPPVYTDPDLQVSAINVSRALASAIKITKVERFVILSSVGAVKSSKTGNILTTHTMEEILKTSPPQMVMVRVVSFVENWLSAVSAVKAGHSPGDGSMYQKLDLKIPHIAELEGREPVSLNDVSKVTSEVLGKPISAIVMTEEMIRELTEKLRWSKTTANN